MLKKVILGAGIIATLLVAYNLASQITAALKSGDRLSAAAEAVYQLEAKNKQLKNKLSQIQTPQFIEKQARDKLGLAKAGESIVVIPEDKLKLIMGASTSSQPRYPNWLGWWKVFFH